MIDPRQGRNTVKNAVPIIRVLMLDFSPSKIADLWHAAASVLPAIEIRLYCRTSRDLDQPSTLAERYDLVLTDASDRTRWFQRLEQVAVKSLLPATIVIAGIEPLESVQWALLRAGYADVVCVQDDHPRAVVNSAIKAYLRQLRAQRIELPSAIAQPIQRTLI
ncbi:MAG: hypothetical protein NVS9B10_04330 [Nevskia sp.]